MSHDPAPSTLPRKPHGEANPFRLSLAHLFLWTATTAVAVLLLRPTFEGAPADLPGTDGVQRQAPVWPAIVAVAVAPVYGVAILGLGMGLRAALFTPEPFEVREPGHWLLMMVGSAFLSFGLLAWFGKAMSDPPSVPVALLFMVGIIATMGCILGLLPLLFLFAAAVEVDRPLRWRIVFQLLAATLVSPMCGCFCASTQVAPFPLIPAVAFGSFLASLLYAAVIDLATKERRDLGHWLGILSVLTVIGHLTAMIFLIPL